MKVVLLAGGFGTRISEETGSRPKPMVEIGGKPILWHIMKYYSAYGLHDFVVCLGYKGYVIKEYFANYALHMSDVTFDIRSNKMTVHNNYSEPWKITLVETGENTQTGGRLRRVQEHLNGTFCLTYGDGVSNVDLPALLKFHKKKKNLATVTAVQPPGRFGVLDIEKESVTSFREKSAGDTGWINGGFFVLEPSVLKYISGDAVRWEEGPLQELASQGQLNAFKHHDFWYAMDTLRDKNHLEDLWAAGKAPWKVWK